MSLKWGEEKEVRGNRQRFLDKYEIDSNQMVVASLASGDKFEVVSKNDLGKMIIDVDALITKDVGVSLFMCVGDCFPVIAYDEKRNILAVIHLGYRGIMSDLFEKVINKFNELGSETSDIQLEIGPGIKKDSYIFDAEKVAQRGYLSEGWKNYLEDIEGGKTKIDLLGFLLEKIKKVGIVKVNVSPVDTIKDLNYFSHYRSVNTGEVEGRIAVFAVMR